MKDDKYTCTGYPKAKSHKGLEPVSFKNKLFIEKQELESKITKLKAYIDSIDYPIHRTTAEELQYIGAMIEQLAAMKRYATYLDKRIVLLKNNDIKLKECERIE